MSYRLFACRTGAFRAALAFAMFLAVGTAAAALHGRLPAGS